MAGLPLSCCALASATLATVLHAQAQDVLDGLRASVDRGHAYPRRFQERLVDAPAAMGATGYSSGSF